MPIRSLPFVVFLSVVVRAPAQAAFPVGVRDLAWANTTGQGSASLTARVHYPAATAGRDVPVLARAGGWPTVVFLHGFAALGSFYGDLGDALAATGYIAVMSETAQFASGTQALDGAALFVALRTANQSTSDPFAGAIDLDHVGLAGHSMGGGNVGNVLASNPGYRCGLALAPVTPSAGNAARVGVPMGIVVGTGDTIAPWQTYAQPFYLGLTGYTGVRWLYLMNGDCTHTNVAGLFVSGAASLAVWQRTLSLTRGFLARFLRDEAAGLEDVFGVGARGESRLVSLDVEVELPQVWPAAAVRIGQNTRLSVAAEPGPAAILIAAAAGSVPTPIGLLRLDPATVLLGWTGAADGSRRFDAVLSVPAEAGLVGIEVPIQAVGAARATALVLGTATALHIDP